MNPLSFIKGQCGEVLKAQIYELKNVFFINDAKTLQESLIYYYSGKIIYNNGKMATLIPDDEYEPININLLAEVFANYEISVDKKLIIIGHIHTSDESLTFKDILLVKPEALTIVKKKMQELISKAMEKAKQIEEFCQ